MKLGFPGNLTIVYEIGHSKDFISLEKVFILALEGTRFPSHGNLWVGHSRESHGSLLGLGTPGNLTVVYWDWALQGVSR